MKSIRDFNWFKAVYVFSLVASVSGLIGVIYSYWNWYLLDLIVILPVVVVFYPIAVIGTLIYVFKHVLKTKSIFELMEMAGAGSGLGGLMNGLNTGSQQEGEDEEEKQ